VFAMRVQHEKEELEAILSDGDNTPDLGSIEHYLDAVATEREMPDFAFCTLRIEECAPFCCGLRMTRCGRTMKACCCCGLHILGGARNQQALLTAAPPAPFKTSTIRSAMSSKKAGQNCHRRIRPCRGRTQAG